MPKFPDPYDHMSDAELDSHLLQLAEGTVPRAVQASAGVVISLRMPQLMLDRLRTAADARGEGYQTLMKRWLEERLAEDAGVDPPPDWDALPEDVVAGVVLTPGQIRTLATRGELLLRVRSPARRAPRKPAQRTKAVAANSPKRRAGRAT